MYCDCLTFCDVYVLELKLLCLETIMFCDASLSDINVVLGYVLSQYHCGRARESDLFYEHYQPHLLIISLIHDCTLFGSWIPRINVDLHCNLNCLCEGLWESRRFLRSTGWSAIWRRRYYNNTQEILVVEYSYRRKNQKLVFFFLRKEKSDSETDAKLLSEILL
jgi:hypothetical protein